MERHSKKIADSSSKRRQVTDKLHKAIEKSKRKTDRQPRDQKKKAMGRRQKADDLENIEITSEEGSFDGNAKPQEDDFFIDEEDGKIIISSFCSFMSIC